MSYLGDTLTVSLILVLLFGSIALYLYTRVQQTEQKVSLLESIVLDLKLTGEIQPFHDDISPVSSSAPLLPASPVLPPVLAPSSPVSSSSQEYTPFEDVEPVESVQSVQPVVADVSDEDSVEYLPLDLVQEESYISTVAYEGMTLKELQALVRSRGLVAEKGAKKQSLVELLKRNNVEQVSEDKPSSSEGKPSSSEDKPGSTSSSSLLESLSYDE